MSAASAFGEISNSDGKCLNKIKFFVFFLSYLQLHYFSKWINLTLPYDFGRENHLTNKIVKRNNKLTLFFF